MELHRSRHVCPQPEGGADRPVQMPSQPLFQIRDFHLDFWGLRRRHAPLRFPRLAPASTCQMNLEGVEAYDSTATARAELHKPHYDTNSGWNALLPGTVTSLPSRRRVGNDFETPALR